MGSMERSLGDAHGLIDGPSQAYAGKNQNAFRDKPYIRDHSAIWIKIASGTGWFGPLWPLCSCLWASDYTGSRGPSWLALLSRSTQKLCCLQNWWDVLTQTFDAFLHFHPNRYPRRFFLPVFPPRMAEQIPISVSVSVKLWILARPPPPAFLLS